MPRKGLFVLIVGPDGAGKSTVAARLVDDGESSRAVKLMHWRPRMLPGLGSLLGRSPGDPSTPHAQPARRMFPSILILAYYWLDFFLGSWFGIVPSVRRGELVIMERGWFDFLVDPRRYRLSVAPWVVHWLGRLLPQPDIVVVLDAPEVTLLSRKTELPGAEVSRQMQVWREFRFPRKVRKVVIDASRSLESVLHETREVIARSWPALISTNQPRWVALPTAGRPRWYLPDSSSAASSAAMLVYHPVTLRARTGWKIAHMLAARGALRLFPASPLPEEIWQEVEPIIPLKGTVAVAKANHPSRYVALVLDRSGVPLSFVKIALDDVGALALAREQEALQRLAQRLPPPAFVPSIQDTSKGMLIFEAVSWHPRRNPWKLPREVAYALGRFFATTVSQPSELGAGHGDLAPWNLLRSERGWAIIDWEDARSDLPPFYDVFHFLVQANLDLHRPSKATILRGLQLEGWVGEALEAYASGANISARECETYFADYLRISSAALDPSNPDNRPGLRVRRRWARTIGRLGQG